MNDMSTNPRSDALYPPRWLGDFERVNDRPLRVLHIGNIANNAYVNAKIMRAIGIDADVICYDYYHMMGTPEWEAGEFEGDYGDPFFPDWWRVKSKFVRPKWFYQGPRSLCLDALNTKFDPNEDEYTAHEIMKLATWYLAYRDSANNKGGREGKNILSRLKRRIDFTFFMVRYSLQHPLISFQAASEIMPFLKVIFGFFQLLQLMSLLGLSAFMRVIQSVVGVFGVTGKFMSWQMAARSAHIRWKIKRVVFDKIVAPLLPMGSRIYFRMTGKRFSAVHGRSATDMYFGSRKMKGGNSLDGIERINSIVQLDEENLSENERQKIIAHSKAFLSELSNYATWQKRHREWHEKLSDKELALDLLTANGMANGWKKLLANYDIIQCYSTDGIIPMPLGLKNYFCFEHGTMRTIPFENNVIGRLTATAYRGARGVFVTNIDNMDKPSRLEISAQKTVWLPHPLDYPRYVTFAKEYGHLHPKPGETVEFFSAARQHWKDHDPGFAKGNDVFFRALAKVLKEGQVVKIILVEWGRDVDASKKLLSELGLSKFVTWIPPMKIDELWKCYLHCHVVVDQFIIPAFGRVTFDSLIFGKRVISNLDKKTAKEFFGEIPPMLVAGNISQATKAVKAVLDDPDDNKKIGEASSKWAEKYHSSQRILDLQLQVYRPVAFPDANVT